MIPPPVQCDRHGALWHRHDSPVFPAAGAGGVQDQQRGDFHFHTVFNLTNTIILFPFANYLVKLSEMIVRDKKGAEAEEEEAAAEQLPQLDDRMMETPSFAIANTLNETIRMSELAIKHVNTAIGAVLTGNEKRMEKSRRIEDAVNEFEKLLMHYLEKLHNLSLTEGQSKLVGDLMYTVKDVERISDHCDNITELAEDLRRSGLSFSGEAQEDLKEMTELSVESNPGDDRAAVHRQGDHAGGRGGQPAQRAAGQAYGEAGQEPVLHRPGHSLPGHPEQHGADLRPCAEYRQVYRK